MENMRQIRGVRAVVTWIAALALAVSMAPAALGAALDGATEAEASLYLYTDGNYYEVIDGYIVVDGVKIYVTDDMMEQGLIQGVPEPTKKPKPTRKPKHTREPEPAVEPEPTPGPEPAVESELTPGPEPAVEPEPTPGPEPAVEPEPTPEPEPAVEPELTPEPEPAVEPALTPEPEPAVEPELTPEPEPAIEPELTPEPEPAEEPLEAPEVQISVHIFAQYAGDAPAYGDTVTLVSAVQADGIPVSYQWQYRAPGGDWADMEGATNGSFAYVLDEVNARYVWRLIVRPQA